MHKLKGIQMSQEIVLNLSDMHIRENDKSQGVHHSKSQNFTLHFLRQANTFRLIFVGLSAHQLSLTRKLQSASELSPRLSKLCKSRSRGSVQLTLAVSGLQHSEKLYRSRNEMINCLALK